MSLIDKLTPQQEALIPIYQHKWRKIALSTERIDQHKAAEAVKAAYALIGISTPKIIFFESPYIGYKIIVLYLLCSYLYRQLKAKDCNQTQNKILFNQLKTRLEN